LIALGGVTFAMFVYGLNKCSCRVKIWVYMLSLEARIVFGGNKKPGTEEWGTALLSANRRMKRIYKRPLLKN